MAQYLHHVSGFFASREEADRALSRLMEHSLPREQLQIFGPGAASPPAASKASSDAVLKDVLVDGAIGTAVGTGIGALGELALVAANVSLFFASPLVAPLMMMGWGASVGGLIGAATGAVKKEGPFSALILDAISSGQVVLVVETRTKQETKIARDVIQTAVGAYEDISTA